MWRSRLSSRFCPLGRKGACHTVKYDKLSFLLTVSRRCFTKLPSSMPPPEPVAVGLRYQGCVSLFRLAGIEFLNAARRLSNPPTR